MGLFRIDASINPDSSASRALGDIIESEWRAASPGETVVRRDVGTDPFGATAWTDAVRAARLPEEQRSPAQRLAVELAASLAADLRAASAVLLTVPLYNLGISQHVKAWIDLVIVGATSPLEALLAGKPAVLVVARGGAYGPGTPREGWDHATGYLRRILANVWGADLIIVEREFTLVGVDPELDEFKEMAAGMRDAALAAAREAGRAMLSRRQASNPQHVNDAMAS